MIRPQTGLRKIRPETSWELLLSGLFGLILFFPFYFSSSVGAAPPAAKSDRFVPQMTWVDMRGNVVRIPSEIRGAWQLDEGNEQIPVKHPSFHVTLRLLNGFNFAEKENTSDTVQLQIASHLTHQSFSLTDSQGRPIEAGAVIEVPSQPPFLWVDSVCDTLGISVRRPKGEAQFLSAAVKCETHPEGADLYFVYSEDLKFETSTLTPSPEVPKSGPLWQRFRVPIPEHGIPQSRLLGSIRLKAADAEPTIEYPILLEPRRAAKKWEFYLASGLGYFHYVEDPLMIRLSEVGVNLNGRARWNLFPRWMSLEASAFGFVLPVFSVPSDSPKAWLIGGNAGADFRLPLRVGNSSFFFKAGWSAKRMLVADNAFGIQLLTGPDFTFSERALLKNNRAIFAFLRFTSIVTGGFVLSNCEIGVGGGYQFSAPIGGKSWSIIGELTSIQFQPPSSLEIQNSAQLINSSLGLQVGF